MRRIAQQQCLIVLRRLGHSFSSYSVLLRQCLFENSRTRIVGYSSAAAPRSKQAPERRPPKTRSLRRLANPTPSKVTRLSGTGGQASPAMEISCLGSLQGASLCLAPPL